MRETIKHCPLLHFSNSHICLFMCHTSLSLLVCQLQNLQLDLVMFFPPQKNCPQNCSGALYQYRTNLKEIVFREHSWEKIGFRFKLPKLPLRLCFLSWAGNSKFSLLRGDTFPAFSCNPQQNIISKPWLMGGKEWKKKEQQQTTWWSQRYCRSLLFLYTL